MILSSDLEQFVRLQDVYVAAQFDSDLVGTFDVVGCYDLVCRRLRSRA